MPRAQRTEAETRALVTEAVVRHVSRHGIDVAPELHMEQILKDAGVSRASAYRLWPGRSAFSAFALEQCAAGHAIGTLDATRARALAEDVVATEQDRLVSAGRFVAKAADEELSILLQSDRWRAFVAFQAVAVQIQRPEIAELLDRIDQEDVARLATVYRTVAEAWGLELAGGFSIESVASAALLMVRSTVARSLEEDVTAQARSTYLAALEALVRGAFLAVPGGRIELDRIGPVG
jgi:AcrR family transcriptional regulator